MKVTTHYSKIEYIEYELNEPEVKLALIEAVGVKLDRPVQELLDGAKWSIEFEDVFEDDDDVSPRETIVRLKRQLELPLEDF